MRKLLAALLLLLLVAAPVPAQDDLDGGALGEEARTALETDNLIKLREVARKMLNDDPKSIAGHFFMAYSLHRSEGDLPRARYNLVLARKLFEPRG